jgi:DNA-binding transcriptional MerR regulator
MAEISQQIDIPNRSLFKAAEVCDLARVQPYVLRSWEAEFKDLGVSKSGSTSRVYRREDVERVLRIRHLLLVEGLTLAGVRRRLEEEAEPPLADEPFIAAAAPLAAATRERIGDVKRGLRSLLDLLDAPVGPQDASAPASTGEAGSLPRSEEAIEDGAAASSEFSLAAPAEATAAAAPKASKRGVPTDEGTKSSSPRRRRSA